MFLQTYKIRNHAPNAILANSSGKKVLKKVYSEEWPINDVFYCPLHSCRKSSISALDSWNAMGGQKKVTTVCILYKYLCVKKVNANYDFWLYLPLNSQEKTLRKK